MQKKITPIIIIILIIAVGAWVLNSEDKSTPGPTTTNGTMLQEETGREIMYQENVEYLPGAKGYLVRPAEEEEFPAVILIHENRGLRPEIRMMADLLAKNGYMVLAVDLLGAHVETEEEAKLLLAFIPECFLDNIIRIDVRILFEVIRRSQNHSRMLSKP